MPACLPADACPAAPLQPFEEYGGLAVNWLVFGTGGHELRPEATTPEAYLRCTPPDHHLNLNLKVIGNTK
jgi:hypothetical protein